MQHNCQPTSVPGYWQIFAATSKHFDLGWVLLSTSFFFCTPNLLPTCMYMLLLLFPDCLNTADQCVAAAAAAGAAAPPPPPPPPPPTGMTADAADANSAANAGKSGTRLAHVLCAFVAKSGTRLAHVLCAFVATATHHYAAFGAVGRWFTPELIEPIGMVLQICSLCMVLHHK